MSHIPLTRDESFHLFSEEQLNQLFLPRCDWKSDKETTRCFDCNKIFFLFFRRKHHCRKCGNIFCSKCSNCFFDTTALKMNIFESQIRLCHSCYNKFDDFRKFLTKEVKQNFTQTSEENNTLQFIEEESKMHDEVDFINNNKGNIFHKNLDSKLEKLVSSVFKEFKLYETYYDILINYLKVALNEVRPNSVYWADHMDINRYIKIKKILYPNSSETRYIRGIVCRKNLLDRKMKQEVENARILLFSSSIDVDFTKFGSFDSFMSQEKNYIKNIVKNIEKLNPNVIFIEKNINRYASEYLKKLNISIFIKVKQSVMLKIARLTRCKIVKELSKLDKLEAVEYIGKCSSLYVKKLTLIENKNNESDADPTKDFLFIEGCNPIYGVTLTISGPDLEQLTELKKCLKSLLKIGRNWLLENAVIISDRDFSKEMKFSQFIQGNLANIDPEIPSFEKLVKSDVLSYTKVNFIKGDIRNIPDFLKNPYLLQELEKMIEQDQNNSVIKISKLGYFGEICGYPSLKKILQYSQEDIALGGYIILKANNLYSKCIACNKPRYNHVSIYYHGKTYIKITTELNGIKKCSPEKHYRKLDEKFPSKISDIRTTSPKNSDLFNFSTPRLSHQNLDLDLTDFSERCTLKPKLGLLCGNQMRSSENLMIDKTMAFERLTRTKTIGWGGSRNSVSPSGTPKSNVNLPKRNAYIKSYLECSNCSEKLTEEKILDHEHLEYSLSAFLLRLFTEKFDEQELKELKELQYINSEEMECLHIYKDRVFQYEETIVKFHVDITENYSVDDRMEFREYVDRTKKDEFQLIEIKKHEYTGVFGRTLEKLGILVEYFKTDTEIIRFGLVEILESLLKEIKMMEKKISQFFQKKIEYQVELEEIRFDICRNIINFFDIFLSFIRVQKKSQFSEIYRKLLIFKKESDFFDINLEGKSPDDVIRLLMESKRKNFFPASFIENILEANHNQIYDNGEIDNYKGYNLLDANLKLSCDPCEYPSELEYELTLQKKSSDLVSKLFCEQQEIFKQKFREDESFQMKHLELEFKEFLKITSGQTINKNDRKFDEEKSNLQIFRNIPVDKQQHLSIIAHALNSFEYMKEIFLFSKKKQEKSISPEINPPKKFHFQTNLIENFISTFTLINENKDEHELQFISQPNVSFPKAMKKVVVINIIIHYPIEFEAFRESHSIELKDFINSLADSLKWKANDPNTVKIKSSLLSHNEYFMFKSLMKKQFDTFLDNATQYLSYMNRMKSEEKPTLLSKIFGAFQITLQNRTFYYICMENLLAGNDDKSENLKIYDLKGSDINRYLVKDRLNRALLDNNYRIERNGEPLPLKIRDKRKFDHAIENDLDFLKTHLMVDYSILLIKNEEKKNIRVGIINFFREKFDNSPQKMPDQNNELNKNLKINNAENMTYKINPVEYANKFRKAMKKYFMEIIDY